MAAYLLLLLLLSACYLPAQAQQAKADSATGQPRIVYTVVNEPPRYTGGAKALGEYLRKNARYSEAARKARLEGRVFASFIVTDQGSIEEVTILKGLEPELDAGVIQLMQNMPKWIPGKLKGKPVNVYFNLPVNFSL
jgi:TonB family protein